MKQTRDPSVTSDMGCQRESSRRGCLDYRAFPIRKKAVIMEASKQRETV